MLMVAAKVRKLSTGYFIICNKKFVISFTEEGQNRECFNFRWFPLNILDEQELVYNI